MRFGFTGIGWYPHWTDFQGNKTGKNAHVDSRPVTNYRGKRWIGINKPVLDASGKPVIVNGEPLTERDYIKFSFANIMTYSKGGNDGLT